MSKYPRVKFGDFVEHIVREVELMADKDYASVGVKWYGEGVHVHEVKDGSSFDAARFQIKENDIIYNDMWARNGSVAIVPKHLDGAVASSHFPTFLPDLSRVLPKYLEYYFKTPIFWNDCENASRGSTGRNQIKKSTFYAIEIPLPPLDEQRRLVARIEALAAKIEEARGLRRLAVEEAKALTKSYLDHTYQEMTAEYQTLRLVDLCHTITDGDHITPRFSEEGVKFIFVGNVSSSYLHFQNCKYVDPEYFASIKPQRKPKRGDVLYSAVGATLGIPAVVDSDEDFCFQRHVAILKPNHAKVDSKYLWYLLRCGALHSLAWSKTTGSAQPTVPLNAIREFPIPTPPLEEQRRIVAYLDGLQGKVDALKHLQSQTQAELDALLPSVLDKAFKGEL